MKRPPTIRKSMGNERVFGNCTVTSEKSGDMTETFGVALRYLG